MRIIVAVIPLLAGACVLWSVPTSASSASDTQAKARTVELRRLMAAEIPIGTPKQKILDWAKRNSIQFDASMANMGRLYANAGHFPNAGTGFPCSAWNVIVDIRLGPNGLAEKETVSTVGDCI